jgi:uncharacterized membrane protein YkvA (DUF1232 family)
MAREVLVGESYIGDAFGSPGPRRPSEQRRRRSRLRRRAEKLKRQIWALFLSWKDPRTPALARVVIAVAIAYALSPIDLIPDFIPVLGQLDDLVILPALIALALKLIPKEVAAASRREAWKRLASGEKVNRPASAYVASALFALLWLALAAWVVSRFL